MVDVVTDAIESDEITNDNISFDMIKNIAAFNHEVWSELGRGRGILDSQEQLNQYLYSYGPMIESQWDNVLKSVGFSISEFEIVDYACGQGLASVLFLDYFKQHVDHLSKVILIEPSQVALDRAASILECYCPESDVVVVNDMLDDVREEDLVLDEGALKVHLFSNILDVNGFDLFKLISKALKTRGRHCLLAVSHDRTFSGGAGRLQEIYEHLTDNENYTDGSKLVGSCIDRFRCDNGNPAIFFFVEVEI